MEDRGRTRAESLGSVVLGGLGMHWHPDGTGARPAPTCSRRPLAIGSPAAQCVFHPVVLKLEATLQTRLNSHRSWIMGCLRGSTIPLPSNSDIDHRQTQIDHPLNHGPSPVARRPSPIGQSFRLVGMSPSTEVDWILCARFGSVLEHVLLRPNHQILAIPG